MMTKILIVDDNESNLYVLQSLVEGIGYEVTTATNGAEALDSARRDRPDIVITDVLMPEMDGFSLCRHLKGDEELKDIPVVFYTATYTDPQDEEFALSLGAERYIVKPQEMDVFPAMLREVLREHRAGRLVAPSEPVEEKEVYLKEYNQTLIRKLEDKMVQLEQSSRVLEQEIAERKRVEAALKESEEMFRTLTETSSAGMFIYRGTRFLYVNPAAEKMTVYTGDELLKMEIWEMVHPDYRELVKERSLLRQRGEKVPSRYEVKFLNRSGKERWVYIDVAQIRFQGQSAVLITAFNITRRKRAEEEIRLLNKELEHRVSERTAELRKMVNLMSGREVRMVELKDVIRRLRDQLLEAGLTPAADDPLFVETERSAMEKPLPDNPA